MLTLDNQSADAPEELYRQLKYSYPKFFKMDALCKWAWLGAESLTATDSGHVYDDLAREKIAVVLATAHGCIDIDKRYKDSIADIPSPALFVYTLPNIMLGELCIRHGFKGEQACMVSSGFDARELHFQASYMLEEKGMDACLCGWVEELNGQKDICLFWVEKNNKGYVFTADAMQQLYES